MGADRDNEEGERSHGENECFNLTVSNSHGSDTSQSNRNRIRNCNNNNNINQQGGGLSATASLPRPGEQVRTQNSGRWQEWFGEYTRENISHNLECPMVSDRGHGDRHEEFRARLGDDDNPHETRLVSDQGCSGSHEDSESGLGGDYNLDDHAVFDKGCSDSNKDSNQGLGYHNNDGAKNGHVLGSWVVESAMLAR